MYELKYRLLDVFSRFGHHLPLWVLDRLDRNCESEPTLVVRLRNGEITLDQFDVRVDWQIVIGRCIDRKAVAR